MSNGEAAIKAMEEKAAREAALRAEGQKQLEKLTSVILTGSEKQITWANDIRRKYVLSKIDLMYYGPFPGVKSEAKVLKFEAISQKVMAITEAKWWIDYRGNLRKELEK